MAFTWPISSVHVIAREYFTERAGNLFCCFVDSSKAFDRVVHCGLYLELIRRGVPMSFLLVLMCWYGGLFCSVMWQGHVSGSFRVRAGVRQGGILSPGLYGVYVDGLPLLLKEAGLGCFVGGVFVGIVIYADDVALLAPSRLCLQRMLDVCSRFGYERDICFNTRKTEVLIIGRDYLCLPPELVLSGGPVRWVRKFKYLGVLRLSRRLGARLLKSLVSFMVLLMVF